MVLDPLEPPALAQIAEGTWERDLEQAFDGGRSPWAAWLALVSIPEAEWPDWLKGYLRQTAERLLQGNEVRLRYPKRQDLKIKKLVEEAELRRADWRTWALGRYWGVPPIEIEAIKLETEARGGLRVREERATELGYSSESSLRRGLKRKRRRLG